MSFDLNTKSGIPIYVQLKERIKLAVATGEFSPGSQLPTVRQLAVQLKINANTVSKVYSELEAERVLATRQGKGTFVREHPKLNKTLKADDLNKMLEELIVRASCLGFSPEELVKELARKIKRG